MQDSEDTEHGTTEGPRRIAINTEEPNDRPAREGGQADKGRSAPADDTRPNPEQGEPTTRRWFGAPA